MCIETSVSLTFLRFDIGPGDRQNRQDCVLCFGCFLRNVQSARRDRTGFRNDSQQGLYAAAICRTWGFSALCPPPRRVDSPLSGAPSHDSLD